MTTRLRILVVEDKESEIVTWREVLEREDFVFARSLLEATEVLRTQIFDAAIIDVRLQKDGRSEPNEDGVAVMDVVTRSVMGVFAIYSAESSDTVRERVSQSNDTIKNFNKGINSQSEVYRWIKGQELMIRSLSGIRSRIVGHMASAYNRAVWPRLTGWRADGWELERLDRSLSRHLVAHLRVDVGVEFEEAHAEEWYFVPSSSAKLDTGDILELSGETRLVVTPRCDVSKGVIHTVRCDVSDEAQQAYLLASAARQKLASAPSDAQASRDLKKAARVLREFWTQNPIKVGSGRHFLPQATLYGEKKLGPFMLEFPSLSSHIGEVVNTFPKFRVATVAPDFLPNLIGRFAAYFARYGHPDPFDSQQPSPG